MASRNDIKAAEKTYDSFIGLLKISVPVISLVTLVVVILISN